MQRLVYYVTHWESNKRIGHYNSLRGARISMRNRNRMLGFDMRIDKLYSDNYEYELYPVDGNVVKGTYCIVEDYIEMENLYD